MTCGKEQLYQEILREVHSRMREVSERLAPHPNYKWLSRLPKMSTQQRHQLQQLVIKLDMDECRAAVIAVRTRLCDIMTPHDVPEFIISTMEHLLHEKNTAQLLRLVLERRRQHYVRAAPPQQCIRTVSSLVDQQHEPRYRNN